MGAQVVPIRIRRPTDERRREKSRLTATLFYRFLSRRAFSRNQLAEFTRQLALLLAAGLPLLRALEVVARQSSIRPQRELIEGLAEVIRSGGSLSDALVASDRSFDRLYINMVRSGEAGGVLDVVLLRLANFLEKSRRVRSRMRTAMIYPAVITGVATAIVTALMLFVVPKFKDIFAGLLKGQPLPMLTQVLISLSTIVGNHFAVVSVGVAAGVLLGRLALGTARGEQFVDWAWLRWPLIGNLGLKAALGRFARTLGTLLGAGVPILQALTIARDTSGNVHVATAIAAVHQHVKVGGAVATGLAAQPLFPPMIVGMVEVGEETGALGDMLNRVADAYDDDVENAVAGLATIIEPVMIVLMALVVGTIVIALFLPLVGIIQQL